MIVLVICIHSYPNLTNRPRETHEDYILYFDCLSQVGLACSKMRPFVDIISERNLRTQFFCKNNFIRTMRLRMPQKNDSIDLLLLNCIDHLGYFGNS